jgi:hypothetical protein
MGPSVRNTKYYAESLQVPKVGCSYFEEASLEFAGGREHVSPQLGITLFGPRSLDILQRHPSSIKVGFIGSGGSIESAKSWLMSCAPGVRGDENNMDFPGFQDDRGFYSKLTMDDNWVETITQHEISSIGDPHFRRDRFKLALEVVSDKVRLLSQRDRPPDYILLAFPDEMLQHCKTAEDYSPEFGKHHVDFRRSIKAEVMKYHLPTQIILKRTSEALPESRNVDHKSKVAWNLFTGLYFKAGGIPWSPKGLRSGTCYVGISFYRPKGDKIGLMRTSVAQAFDEHGNGLVLRGQDFSWDKPDLTPHLDEEKARDLVELVLKRYEDEMKQKPSRVVIHKTSKFWPEEGAGFQKALRSVRQFDLVSVRPTNEIRLLRAGKYPPLRGTRFSVGGKQFLYTTGFIPALKAYPHGHVPSPLQIEHCMGDSPLETILQEILVLTKMNWNSASFAGLLPITLKFAMRVGEIMREIPSTREPLPQFKYYM